MIRIISITLSVLLFFNSNAQKKCDLSELNMQEKRQLTHFWNDLQKAVNNKNKNSLAKLCHFSFKCSICEGTTIDTPTLAINRKMFYAKHYKILLTKYFTEKINKNEILKILKADKMDDNSCYYSFSFPIIKPSGQAEGMQGFLSIKKFGDEFLIISVWSVP